MDHPNIVRMLRHFQDDTHLSLVCEYVNGGDLYTVQQKSRRERFNEGETAHIVQSVAKALRYCHDQAIVHCDVKLENVLIDKSGQTVKLTDFGWCVREQDAEPGLRGTLHAVAPEMFDYKRPIDRAVDVWALGVIAFELLHGYLPFLATTRDESLTR